MPEQITYYHDTRKTSPFCQKVEIALKETGASYKSCGFDVYNKPAWFAQANPLTGKIPAITHGGPNVPPEEPSPLSFKLTESNAILEFLADLFPNSTLLPPASDPTARARVRFFMDVVVRELEVPMFDRTRDIPSKFEKVAEALEKIQALLPDPDASEGGEYAIGKQFTNADCAIAPMLAFIEIATTTDIGRFEPGMLKKFAEMFAGEKFDRLTRYKKALWERESVKKVIDFERMAAALRARHAQE